MGLKVNHPVQVMNLGLVFQPRVEYAQKMSALKYNEGIPMPSLEFSGEVGLSDDRPIRAALVDSLDRRIVCKNFIIDLELVQDT